MQQERDEQAREARRELELRGELPHGMPEPHVAWPELHAAIEALPQRLSLSRWATGEHEAPDADAAVRLPFGPAAAYGGRLRVLAEELTQTLRGGQQVVDRLDAVEAAGAAARRARRLRRASPTRSTRRSSGAAR